jgi:predicted membrane protein
MARDPYPHRDPDTPSDHIERANGGTDTPAADDGADGAEQRPRYRGERSDPIFGYLVAVAVALGTAPFLPAQADLRYTLSWGALAAFGVLAWLLGNSTRIADERPEDLAWGVVFGLILALLFLAFGGGTLSSALSRLFVGMNIGTVLAYMVFVMPLGETLFFRALMQNSQPFWAVALFATVWAGILFLPLLDVGRFPAPSALIMLMLLMMNLIYGYVRDRNGLAAAWLCQITCNVILLALPLLSRPVG